MNVGDKVQVNKAYNLERRTYPFMPALSGMKGIVVEVKQIENEKLYKVKFDKSFLVGIIPDGESAAGYKPKEWKTADTWYFTTSLDLI